ncbi:uncharacterized protein [Amphiura filiformis]|uniref:uncharacterized protein n=1 Tax=Amphiura filiformis TaxID=82378 RepID=UPI003B21177F
MLQDLCKYDVIRFRRRCLITMDNVSGVKSSIWVCLMVLPGVMGQELDNGSIIGIAAGSGVAFILAIAVVIMCALIVMRSSTNSVKNTFQSSRFTRNRATNDVTLNPAPNTISYGQSAYASSLATTRTPALVGVGTPSPFAGSSILGAADASWGGGGMINSGGGIINSGGGIINSGGGIIHSGGGIINSGGGGGIVNSVQPLHIQETAVPLDLQSFDTYL